MGDYWEWERNRRLRSIKYWDKVIKTAKKTSRTVRQMMGDKTAYPKRYQRWNSRVNVKLDGQYHQRNPQTNNEKWISNFMDTNYTPGYGFRGPGLYPVKVGDQVDQPSYAERAWDWLWGTKRPSTDDQCYTAMGGTTICGKGTSTKYPNQIKYFRNIRQRIINEFKATGS